MVDSNFSTAGSSFGPLGITKLSRVHVMVANPGLTQTVERSWHSEGPKLGPPPRYEKVRVPLIMRSNQVKSLEMHRTTHTLGLARLQKCIKSLEEVNQLNK